jgi:glycosyltransferase involved in cell wall biosynthesis
VRNGIDKAVFGPVRRLPARAVGPLKVLVEGSSHAWFKDVGGALAAVGAMREPHALTVVTTAPDAVAPSSASRVVGPLSQAEMATLYGEVDVLVKLSRVEGMFGPPLEGFHRGATCVVTPVTGYEEYVEHGWNGMLTDWDDQLGTARQLDLLARDRELLTFLRRNALATASSWPSWEQSGVAMAAALRAIAAEPPAQAAAAAARMLADLREGLEIYRVQLDERADFHRRAARYERLLRRLVRTPPGRMLRAVRRNRYARRLARPVRPLLKRVKQRLLG